MQTQVNRGQLLEILRKNRDNHRAIFEEAVEGFRTKALEELESQIEAIKSNKKAPIQVFVSLHAPEDHTYDYDRVIGLLEMSSEIKIDLNDDEFATYVQDDWGWKRSWLLSNSQYSPTAYNMVQSL